MMRKAEIILEYQPYIDYMPIPPKELFAEACKSDEITISSWRPTWEKNVKANHERFKSFEKNSIGKFFGHNHHKPAIIVGSGPSIKYNAHELKNKQGMCVLSCLHNFHYLEDLGVDVDFYVTLDAGDVTIEEVYEGGAKTPDEYWAMTKKKKLFAYIGTSPKLLEKWQGEVYFYNAPVPNEEYSKYIEDIEKFNVYVSNGGNVLGACLYIAKAFFGSSMVGFLGADFSFSYDKKFHGWDSKYDTKMGHCLRVTDIFGNKVYTWKSYHNFKGWFENIAATVPGVYYNLSEGGIFGAYGEGNIRPITQMSVKDFFRQMNIYKEIEEQAKDPKTDIKKLLF